MACLAAAAAAVLLASGVLAEPSQYIYPGLTTHTPHWNDTDGNRIEAHAAGMFQDPVSSKWFWYGESRKDNNLKDHGVNCYSSASIAGPWKFEGQVIAQKDIPVPTGGSSGPFIVERPKTLYNGKTKKYVCWFHLDTSGYKFRHVGIFESDAPIGPFVFVHALQPDGIPSLDMSLFEDPVDHTAYFVRSCNNAYTGISRLTDDYHNTTGLISNHSVFEGMALFRHPNGTYYIITSHLTGWSPNPLMLYRAAGKTLDDPQWVDMGNPTGSRTSFNTQPTYVVQYTPPTGEPYFVYMADNWVHGGPSGLVDASYVWLPFKFNEDNITLSPDWRWSLDDPFAPVPPAPPAPPPSCNLPTASGSQLYITPCATTPANVNKWQVYSNNGTKQQIQLQNTSLCIGIANAGHGAATLYNCNDPRSSSKAVVQGGSIIVDGKCLDVQWCGTAPCAGDSVVGWKCGSETGNNEHWSFDTAHGTITSEIKSQAPLCLAACSPSL